MSLVDDDLEGAVVRITNYSREQYIATVTLKVPWSGTLAVDAEGEMKETGTVVGTARFKHLGRSLELVGAALTVEYDTLFTSDEDGD